MNKNFVSAMAWIICIVLTFGALAACVDPVVSTGPATAGSSLTAQLGGTPSDDGSAVASMLPEASETPEASHASEVTEAPIPSNSPFYPTETPTDGTATPAPTPDATQQPTRQPTAEPTVQPTPHQHNFRNATCTQGGVCDCGATGPALGHHFKAATCTAPATCTRCGLTGDPALGHSYSGGYCIRCGDTNGPLSPEEAKWFHNSLTDAQNAEALAVARSIVASIPAGTDLERVGAAAAAVSDYYYNGVHSEPVPGHEAEHNKYYREAYGVFIVGESSCAGCTRALGLILSVMGYSWTHVNENQYEHQWISLMMDGQEGFADGQVGWVGYGKHPLDDSGD